MGRNEEIEAKWIIAERDLEDSKRFNKVAAGLIIILLLMLGAMLMNMQRLAKEYEEISAKCEMLYEELRGGQEQ